MAEIKSTEQIILEHLLKLAKAVDRIEKALFINGWGQKLELLWTKHPELKKKLKSPTDKNRRRMETN